MNQEIHLKIRRINFVFLFFVLSVLTAYSQSGSIKGKITDATTGEGLIGANVLIQGTTKGASTDLDGFFIINAVPDGTYNLIVSYVSYEQQIIGTEIKEGNTAEINVNLQSSSITLGEVKVTANKRTDTEMSMISSIRNDNLLVNGISKQQISRTQDKDASEIISRVPGVTVRDGKFINVRGLDERYNVVLINGIGAPSSESDRRAFSFDMLPSSLIDNLILYKTPAPEIPADFAGAVVQMQTRNTVESNSTDITYYTGYRQNTTFEDLYSYKGGKYDWLGFDDGTRALPASFPSTSEFRELSDSPDESDKAKINELGRSFNKIWSPRLTRSIPDQALNINLNRRFLIGDVSIGNVTSLGYSTGDQYRQIFRAGYQAYDIIHDRPDTSFYFNDDVYSTRTKLNGLFNWLFVFGKNQKIEFRNFFNQLSDKQTILRLGRDFYGGSYKSATELSFQSRSIYTGQLGGNFNFKQSLINLNWTLGYSYTNKLQPDIRRIEMSRNEDSDNDIYTLSLNFNADPKLLGRLSLKTYEHIYFGGINYAHKIPMGNITPEFKTGILIEQKNREYIARNIGYAISNVLNFNWNLVYQPIDSVFQDKNINFTDGIKLDESTDLSDSYNAGNELYATYAGLNIPFRNLKFYAGLRLEKNIQKLEGYDRNGTPISIDNGFTDFFPSLNLTYDLTDKSLFRFAYGRTINRPEFREISPHTYYDFEEKATIYGNPGLKNSYIQNLDLRYEFFPANGDMITLGGFYKHFTNPIEAHLVEAGSGRNYTYDNAELAQSYGLEVDMRKSLTTLEGSNSRILNSFRHFILVFNAALIKSRLHTNDPNARESVRKMQGQSPYIFNVGVFYDNHDKELMISVLYNVIGPRIMYVGDIDEPHIIQMPRNLIDVALNKRISKYITLRAGIKDLINQPVELRQNERIQLIPGNSESETKRIQRTQIYKPSTSFLLGFSVNF
jgi:hypothetical protein